MKKKTNLHFLETALRIFSKSAHLLFELSSKFLPSDGVIFMFHDVGKNGGILNLPKEEFESLLKKLCKKNTVRLEEWEKSKNFFALTFDDVPESFYENAFPLLKKYDLPFTLFISTTLLDTPGYITSAQLKEISACELSTIGSHGDAHCFFRELSTKQALEDLINSQKILEEKTNRKIILYAFPYGSFFACGFWKKSLVSKIYKYGFSSVGVPISQWSPLPKYFLPRINASIKQIKNYINT